MSHDYSYKIVLIGDSSVGKSSLIRRFADDSFEESYLATIGVDFKFKTVQINKESAKLQIWDTAGQQRFRTITSAYYKHSQGIMIVFDLQYPKTFENIEEFWLEEIAKYAEKDVKIFVVGNKADCEQSMIKVKQDELAKFSLKHSIPTKMVSAKTGQGVREVFEELTASCIKQFGKIDNESKNRMAVVEDIRKKKADFKLKTGNETKKKACC